MRPWLALGARAPQPLGPLGAVALRAKLGQPFRQRRAGTSAADTVHTATARPAQPAGDVPLARAGPVLSPGRCVEDPLGDAEFLGFLLGPQQHLLSRFDDLDDRGGDSRAAIPMSLGGGDMQSPDRLDPLMREDLQRELFVQRAVGHGRKSRRRSLKIVLSPTSAEGRL
jgi:hypothetical protein